MSLPAFLLFIVLAFVTFRLSEMLVIDRAPFDLAFRLRAWTGLYDTDESGNAPFVNSNPFQIFVGQILDCVYCTGVWVAGLAAIAWGVILAVLSVLTPLQVLVLTPLVWLGLAGAQAFLVGSAGRRGQA